MQIIHEKEMYSKRILSFDIHPGSEPAPAKHKVKKPLGLSGLHSYKYVSFEWSVFIGSWQVFVIYVSVPVSRVQSLPLHNSTHITVLGTEGCCLLAYSNIQYCSVALYLLICNKEY